MSVKIIADSLKDFPEHLQEKAKEVDGKFELDAKGVLSKNTELLGKNSTLSEKVTELEASRDEWKSKAAIPNDQKLVSVEIAELGEAAKAAEIGKDEMPGLKSAKSDLEAELSSYKNEKVISEVANALGLNNRFILAARDKNLEFEKTTEKEGAKNIDVWNVVKDGNKTKVEEFLISDSYFKEFADTFKNTGKKILGQESGQGGQQQTTVEQEMQAQASTGRYSI